MQERGQTERKGETESLAGSTDSHTGLNVRTVESS